MLVPNSRYFFVSISLIVCLCVCVYMCADSILIRYISFEIVFDSFVIVYAVLVCN